MSKRATKALHTVACFLGLHKVKVLGTDGASTVGRCQWCKKYVIQDSHGGWSTVEGTAYVLKGASAEKAIKERKKDETQSTRAT